VTWTNSSRLLAKKAKAEKPIIKTKVDASIKATFDLLASFHKVSPAALLEAIIASYVTDSIKRLGDDHAKEDSAHLQPATVKPGI
jgi:hypothetical protein